MSPRFAVPFGLASVLLCSFAPDAPGAVARDAVDAHADELFTTSEQCGVCHLTAVGARAMRDAEGEDVSPYATWQATMMANSFRDPYFHAQLQKETAAAGEQVQELCLRCHAPMLHHENVLAGKPAPRLADAEGDVFADDGVSCTVCHLMDGANFGKEESFSGRPTFTKDRRIFGPFADVAPRPMQMHVNYTPVHGPHVQKAALCATCHTLTTEHQGTPFKEQTPYLEWRNSEFSDERDGADPAKARTCQQCHMPRSAPTRIARNPMGFDFRIPEREGYAVHGFVGGNAFMLGLLRDHREELDVLAEPAQFDRTIAATKQQLAEATARLEVTPLVRDGGALAFGVKVENLTGHKFPTGYPARRAWLHVQVLRGGEVVFESGAHDDKGRIRGVGDELSIAHPAVVTKASEAVVYEMVAAGPDGAPTTYLTKMTTKRKDTRLLPRGWTKDGPHADATAPIGVDGDADFAAGGDVAAFRVPLPAGDGPCEVRATLRYQSVPPAWVDALRGLEAEQAKRFVGWYDAADKTPETVATARRGEG
jgi:hypothetical protein